MVADARVILRRDQLRQFLGDDHQLIKAFERLQGIVSTTPSDFASVTQSIIEADFEAGVAIGMAIQALDTLAAIQRTIDLMPLPPYIDLGIEDRLRGLELLPVVRELQTTGVGQKYVVDTSPKITTPDIVGVTDASNAAAGSVGETISSSIVVATNFPATGTWGDLTSIVLTAGDWDITGQLLAILNGATMTGGIILGVSTTAGNSAVGLTTGMNRNDGPRPTATDNSSLTLNYRVNIAAGATHYLKFQTQFSAGAPQGFGFLMARRRR